MQTSAREVRPWLTCSMARAARQLSSSCPIERLTFVAEGLVSYSNWDTEDMSLRSKGDALSFPGKEYSTDTDFARYERVKHVYTRTSLKTSLNSGWLCKTCGPTFPVSSNFTVLEYKILTDSQSAFFSCSLSGTRKVFNKSIAELAFSVFFFTRSFVLRS
jgi:hypothetical protein